MVRSCSPACAARAAALALAAALSACTGSGVAQCPGETIATLQLVGTRSSATCTAPDGSPVPSDAFAAATPPTMGPPDLLLQPVPITVTLSGDPTPGASGPIALCTGRRLASIYYGTRDGDHFVVSTGGAGAVLEGCAATCRAVASERLEGTLVFDGSGRATGLTGATYTDTFASDGGACGDCTLPCAAVYDLTVVAVGP